MSFSILSYCRVTGVSSKLLDLKKAQIMLSKGPAFSQVEQGKFWILQVLLCLLKLQEKANCKLMSNSEIWSAIIVFYFFLLTHSIYLLLLVVKKWHWTTTCICSETENLFVTGNWQSFIMLNPHRNFYIHNYTTSFIILSSTKLV